MEGVIYGICPTAKIVHLSHQVPPQNVQTGAFVLYQSFGYFPTDTVHCAVIDPGVGSHRRAIAVRTDRGILVGPDNGLFDLVLSTAKIDKVVTLTNPDYQLSTVSATFHGRDIFAPAAAHLAAGVPLGELGAIVPDLEFTDRLKSPEAGYCRVIHVDHFGNAVLSLTAGDVSDVHDLSVTIGDTVIGPLQRTFADVEKGSYVLYVGSSNDHIEIAMRNHSAAQALDLQPGDVVQYAIA
jgi:S-adenosylmethionine hydrolase